MKTILTFFLLILFYTVQAQMQYTSPMPGAVRQHPNQNIVIRPGTTLDATSFSAASFSISGSISGDHSFKMIEALDGKTINLNPDKPFAYGENVTVVVKPGIHDICSKQYPGYTFSFSIHREYTATEQREFAEALTKMHSEDDPAAASFQSESEMDNPQSKDFKIKVNTTPAAGQVFFSNNGVDEKLYIIQNNGDSVYETPPADVGKDWKLNHNNYMTAFDENGFYDMYDSNYLKIVSFHAINGYSTDEHEFQIFPDGHYFLIGDDVEIVDMTVYNSSYQPNALVTGNVIQEFDAQNNLLFEWNTFDHINIPEALHENLANGVIDAVHMNSIEEDTDGNIIVSCRHLDQIDKIDLSTGDFIWRLGGDSNQFKFTNDPAKFNYQHDVRRLPIGNITVFDNNNWGSPNTAYAKEYQLNEVKKKATLIWSYAHPPVHGVALTSGACGSIQRFDNGNTLIDWGLIAVTGGFPNLTEVDSNNNIVWEMSYSNSEVIYRAHRFSWDPCSRPSDSKLKVTNITATTATLNWNAATGVVKYYVQYRKQGANKWKNKKVSSSALSLALTGLLANTTYEWNIETWCNSTGTDHSAFTATKTFTTASSRDQDISSHNVQFLDLYPNPGSDVLTIQWVQGNNNEQPVSLCFINLMGQCVMERKLASNEGMNESSFNIQSLPKGFYIIRMVAGENSFEMKWTKE